MPDRTKILATADLHLGRYPSVVTPGEAGLSVTHVWRQIVRRAIDGGAGLVLLAGDVIDQSNKYFEAIGPITEGLAELAAEGIHTCAVSGNHDWDALPEVAGLVDEEFFHLLGRGGGWERWAWSRPGGGELTITGWSYPSQRPENNPLAPGVFPTDGADIGLLHCDAYSDEQRYVPVSNAMLASAKVRGWVLGHIHARRVWSVGHGWAVYPGSPQPLDAGEPGAHGVYWIDPTTWDEPTFEPVATVRYEPIEIAASDEAIEGSGGVREWVLTETRDRAAGLAEGQRGVAELVARVTVTGRTKHHRRLRPALTREDDDIRATALRIGEQTQLRIERFDLATRPAIDLEEQIQLGGPVAAVAQALLDLRAGKTDTPVLGAIAERLGQITRRLNAAPAYTGLDAPLPTDLQDWRDEIERTGWALLDALAAQKDPGGPEAATGEGSDG